MKFLEFCSGSNSHDLLCIRLTSKYSLYHTIFVYIFLLVCNTAFCRFVGVGLSGIYHMYDRARPARIWSYWILWYIDQVNLIYIVLMNK